MRSAIHEAYNSAVVFITAFSSNGNRSSWRTGVAQLFKIFFAGKERESRSRKISYMKHANGRRTGLVTFCVETAFYNGLLKERYKGG